MEEVNRSENVRTMMGTARSMLPLEEQVILDIAYDTTIEQDRYDYVVVATGFDPLWFTDLMDEASQQKYFFREGKMPDRTSIERTIERDLSVQSLSPRLHLPMLAGTSQGPGFPNLSCLGLLSDRILASYHHKE
jgi:mycobactin lysine-N-oxygenase